MNIAVLGGSFDPPHIGHYFVIKQILELRKDIDKILLVPAYKHQWKPSFASVEDRLNMLKYFVDNRVSISDIEIQRKGISYTIDTIKELKSQTKSKIYWIVGSDILYEFNRWEKKDKLVKLARFLVFPRDPYQIPKKTQYGFECIQDKCLITTNISSTAIRQRVKEGKSITAMVLKEVEEYITMNKLYKQNPKFEYRNTKQY